MTDSFTRLARDRLQQLSSTLTMLRERVRDAVASEIGKAVGEALRDLLTAVLSKTQMTPRMPEQQPPLPAPDQTQWDVDNETHWQDDPKEFDLASWSVPTSTPVKTSPSPVVALSFGVNITRWLLKRQVPIWAGVGAGVLAGLATLSHHPFLQAGLGVVAAAAELLAITEFTANSP